jgi:16S rRNA processing protein RimM
VTAPELVIVGRLRKAHGVKGELVVEPLTDNPDRVYAAGRRLVAGTVDGEPDPRAGELVVAAARPAPHGDGLLVAFASITDRTSAELWRDRYLLAPRAELEPPGEHEVYVHELVGMRVSLRSGEQLGKVLEVYELPQGLVLDISRPGGSVVLPFRAPFVVAVDRAERAIVIDPPDGLLD